VEEEMTTKRTQSRLNAYERRYRDLAEELANVGYITSGSVALRYNRCGKSNCACQVDPAKRHGPYWVWTAKVDGKTVSRWLNEHEAGRYQEWIANDRHVRELLTQMRAVATKATQLLLAEGPGE
jgi:adenosyl cobinamide kinase/adenosyl cobinamide phosphate guanylyltransferase